MIHKSNFGKKVGRGFQWITDPKQLLTAAGFVWGGPIGAGVGRAIGGLTPDPWGNRESTLADGLQWRDAGQAGKDFLSGYSAGKVGQQIPGIKDLEGAFAQEGLWGGAGMPGGSNIPESLPKLTPGEMPGQSIINAERGWPGLPAPYTQQPMPGVPALYTQRLAQLGTEQIPGQSLLSAQQPMAGVPAVRVRAELPLGVGIPEQSLLNAQQQVPGMPAPSPGAFQPGPLPFELSSNVGGADPLTAQAAAQGAGVAEPFKWPEARYLPADAPPESARIGGGLVTHGVAEPFKWPEARYLPADAPLFAQPQPKLRLEQIPGRPVINQQINMPEIPEIPGEEPMWKRGAGAARKWFGELTPMEQIYLATQVPQIASSFGGGGHKIGREGTALLGEMGMFSRTPRYQPSSFDRWRSA